VKVADPVAVHAGTYALRIPAACHDALHADIIADWEVAMPELLAVVSGDDVVTSVESTRLPLPRNGPSARL
jgi:hypothetical protein